MGPVGLGAVLVEEVVLVPGAVVDVDVVEIELEGTEDGAVVEDLLVETDTVDDDADETPVDVEDETTVLEEADAGIESSPGVYFVRS